MHPDGSVYFTDPYDGFLENGKRPLGDHNYTSDKSAIGFAGVYRVPPPPRIGAADPASPMLITATLERPKGIGFEPPHPRRPHEHALWHSNYTRERTVEWVRPGGGGGCADGFKLLARDGHATLLIGACPMGVCVVDAERTDEAMLEYVEFPMRVSNVALGGDYLYVTGEAHLWRLPLAKNLFEPLPPRPDEQHFAFAKSAQEWEYHWLRKKGVD